ncbi:MAG TPA: hypothetical protein VF915_14765 [Reyranella sp.]
MSDLTWTYTDGVRTVAFIPLGRAPVWKGESRMSERQLIGTNRSEISVFGSSARRLKLSVFLDGDAEMLSCIALDTTQGTLTMDGGATKTVTLLVGEMGAAEFDRTYAAQLTFVEVA